MAQIRLEIRPWLSDLVSSKESGVIFLEREIQEGITLGDLFTKLAAEHQAFGQALFDSETQQVSDSMAIVINGQLLQSLKRLDASLKDGDTITLLPFIDGG